MPRRRSSQLSTACCFARFRSHNPDRLVAVWIAQPSLAKDPVVARLAERTVLGAEELGALRDRTTAYSGYGYWIASGSMLATSGSAEQVQTVDASASLLDVLGEHTVLGRGLRPEENVLNGPRVALVSWETWTSRFGGDSSVIGRRIQLDDAAYTIVGVLPRGLRLDRAVAPAAFWVPAMQGQYDQPQYHNRSYHAVARLRPGITPAAAELETARAFRSAAGRYDALGARSRLAVRSNARVEGAALPVARGVRPAPAHRLRQRGHALARRIGVARA